MIHRFQERHQDYVCGPLQDGRLASITPGQVIQGIRLQLDPDAPFILRSRALRVPYDAARTQNTLQNISMRYCGPNDDYRQQAPVPQNLEMAYFGQCGNPKPVWPNIKYPAGGVILIDVTNTSAVTTVLNLTMYFRGVKLYPAGSGGTPSYTYPPKFDTPRPFIYPFTIPLLPVTTPTQGIRQQFVVKPDADFVVRSIQSGRTVTPTSEVFITLLDENLKPYSNAPVHVDVLCGNSAQGSTFPIGPVPSYLAPVGAGASNPGILSPELYIPKTHILYYDVVRSDAGYAGSVAADFPLAFSGMKVYAV